MDRARLAQLLVRGGCLPLKGVIDLSAERARLEKEIARLTPISSASTPSLEQVRTNAPEDIVGGKEREAAVALRKDSRGTRAIEKAS